MIIGKNFTCYKRLADGAVSVLVEHKQKNETLLFEKGVVAELGKQVRSIRDLSALSSDYHMLSVYEV